MNSQTNAFKNPSYNQITHPGIQSENYVLAALPSDAYSQLTPHLKRISLEQGRRLYEPGDLIREIYFPIDCVLSITMTMSNGATVETGMIGRREMLGLYAFMGGSTTQTSCSVQAAGSAMKVNAEVLKQEFNRNQGLRDVFLRYTQAFLTQVSQTAACNRLHLIEHRLARWLLEVQDRVKSDNLRLTHEFIADMLGVRRAGVTQAAQKLQESGIIGYNRGQIQLLDQHRLEASACECFHVIKDEYARLLNRTGNS